MITTAGRSPGLVLCAKTGRRTRRPSISALQAWDPRYPSGELVDAAASMFDALPRWDGHEGPRARVDIAPGVVAVTRCNRARRERTIERQHQAYVKTVDMLAAQLLETGQFPPDGNPHRVIVGWSRKSRARMWRRTSELDYGPYLDLIRAGRAPIMITLTYPGDWLVVAPSGKSVKRHLAMFRRAWARAWREQPIAIWKMEFQDRGAPHFHLFMAEPHGLSAGRHPGLRFRQWLSTAWAAIVNHPDRDQYRRHLRAGTGVDYREALRCTDPKRLAVYFAKHGSRSAKEYQHIVPPAWRTPETGPGRFWGYWTLRPLVVGIELGDRPAVWTARIIRRWWHAKGLRQERMAPRRAPPRPATHDITGLAGLAYWEAYPATRYRPVTRRSARMRTGAGYVVVNSGPNFASDLARAVDQLTTATPS